MSEWVQRFVVDIEAPYDVLADADAPYSGAALDEVALLPGDDAERGALGLRRGENAPHTRVRTGEAAAINASIQSMDGSSAGVVGSRLFITTLA